LNIQNNGKKWVTPAFLFFYLPDTSPAHVGFTATKKLGGAVVRNRIKRRLRAAADLFSPDSGKMVFVARPEALTRDLETLVKDMRWAMRRISEVKEPDEKDK
jgi:ribonuclease P protein component